MYCSQIDWYSNNCSHIIPLYNWSLVAESRDDWKTNFWFPSGALSTLEEAIAVQSRKCDSMAEVASIGDMRERTSVNRVDWYFERDLN